MDDSTKRRLKYEAPDITDFELTPHSVLCLSGDGENSPYTENDFNWD